MAGVGVCLALLRGLMDSQRDASAVRRLPARWPDLLWSLAIGVVVLGPMLIRRGYVLRGDMVFVPRMPWKDAWLGLDGSVGRAVPVDALVSVATSVVPGDLLQKASCWRRS